jgi:hypothetical protein
MPRIAFGRRSHAKHTAARCHPVAIFTAVSPVIGVAIDAAKYRYGKDLTPLFRCSVAGSGRIMQLAADQLTCPRRCPSIISAVGGGTCPVNWYHPGGASVNFHYVFARGNGWLQAGIVIGLVGWRCCRLFRHNGRGRELRL